jgi:hypothetical protein
MNQYVNPLKMEMNGDVIYYLNIHILMVQVWHLVNLNSLML